MTVRNEDQTHLRNRYQRKGLAYGMAVFPIIGIAISLITAPRAVVASGVAQEPALGPVFGEYLYRREISQERREKEINRESD